MQYIVYYNLCVCCMGFYSLMLMVWVFKWKWLNHTLSFARHCRRRDFKKAIVRRRVYKGTSNHRLPQQSVPWKSLACLRHFPEHPFKRLRQQREIRGPWTSPTVSWLREDQPDIVATHSQKWMNLQIRINLPVGEAPPVVPMLLIYHRWRMPIPKDEKLGT